MLLPQCGVLLTNSASIVNSCYCCYCHWGSECGIRRYWRRRRSPESPVDGAFTRTIPAHPLAGADVGGSLENCGWRTLAENSITGARRIRRITSSWNGIKRARCIRGQRSQGDFRTVASPMASTPHWGGHLSPPDPLSPPSSRNTSRSNLCPQYLDFHCHNTGLSESPYVLSLFCNTPTDVAQKPQTWVRSHFTAKE